MKAKNWHQTIILTCMLLVALASGAVAADTVKLADAFGTSGVHPFYIADDLGYFAAEGIKPEFVGVVPPPQLVAAVIAGRLDVGGAHVNRTIAGMILQQALGLGLIGFVVGKLAATFWAPIFPKYVLLEPGDAVRGLVAVVVICALASTLAIRIALKVDPAAAIGG